MSFQPAVQTHMRWYVGWDEIPASRSLQAGEGAVFRGDQDV
jgi:hypothetical protein